MAGTILVRCGGLWPEVYTLRLLGALLFFVKCIQVLKMMDILYYYGKALVLVHASGLSFCLYYTLLYVAYSLTPHFYAIIPLPSFKDAITRVFSHHAKKEIGDNWPLH